jgi:hypothetical protein
MAASSKAILYRLDLDDTAIEAATRHWTDQTITTPVIAQDPGVEAAALITTVGDMGLRRRSHLVMMYFNRGQLLCIAVTLLENTRDWISQQKFPLGTTTYVSRPRYYGRLDFD